MNGSGGLPNPSRQLGGNLSFAQSLSGSQPATPLDLSEFPSLSGNAQQNPNQAPMWGSTGSRNPGGGSMPQRAQGAPMSGQQGQQEEIFGGSSRMSSGQGAFRFGSQSAASSQPSQPQQGPPEDPFPPLSRNANGEIGGERSSNLMSSMGFAAAPGGSSGAAGQPSRGGNGLLNALSANARASDARSPVGTRPQDTRGSVSEEDQRMKGRDAGMTSQSPIAETSPQQLGPIGVDVPTAKGKEAVDRDGQEGEEGSQVTDPLPGMSGIDRWGIKGLRTLMQNYPDYNALQMGMDPNSLGLDLNSTELISTQIYSLFDDAPPHPAAPKFRIPECYKVGNVGPVDTKMGNFNEETLMWIFYSCPRDIKQAMAAVELNSRNWRWHKKLQIWLTKDDMMMPQVLSPSHERGYYIIWNTATWGKDRREFTLNYADLETNPMGGPAAGLA